MFENIINFFKKAKKKEAEKANSKDKAKERLHLVLMQDRANVSVDFLDLMRQEIIEVIKKYIEIDEKAIDVRLTNQENEDGTQGAPALYANIPIVNIKEKARNAKKESDDIKKNDVKEEEQKKADTEEENTEKEEIKIEDQDKIKEKEIEKIEEKAKKIVEEEGAIDEEELNQKAEEQEKQVEQEKKQQKTKS